MIFEMARRAVGLEIRPALGHETALMDLVEQDVSDLLDLEIVVEPDLAGRNELVDLVVAALRVIDEVEVADHLSVHDPNPNLVRAIALRSFL